MSDSQTPDDERSRDAEGLIIPTEAEIAEQLTHYEQADHGDDDGDVVGGVVEGEVTK